jgi:hypothetical protein
MNRLEEFASVFDGVKPFSGAVPRGYEADFIGILTDLRYLDILGFDWRMAGARYISTAPPSLRGINGEDWFERVNWFVAAREARGHFTMLTLGACWGAQAVGAARALQLVNPMPYRLVGVEPIPEHFAWMLKHMRENGVDPERQWLLKCAISDRNEPVLFPVGAAGSGTQNCMATNHLAVRRQYADQLAASGDAEEALRNLLVENRTGIRHKLVEDHDFTAELKLVSAVTLADLLGPFDVVDYIESDIQQSEIVVFPPFLDLLTRKVRRIHIGTHGTDVHKTLHALFRDGGWEIVFSYEPNATHDSALGSFTTNDGILTVRNPNL